MIPTLLATALASGLTAPGSAASAGPPVYEVPVNVPEHAPFYALYVSCPEGRTFRPIWGERVMLPRRMGPECTATLLGTTTVELDLVQKARHYEVWLAYHGVWESRAWDSAGGGCIPPRRVFPDTDES